MSNVAHFYVGDLTDSELQQVSDQAPELRAVLDRASPGLRRLAASPFNLRLLADLVAPASVGTVELRGFDTSTKLLESFWDRRALAPPEESDDREHLLRSAVTTMVNDHRLQVPRSALQQSTNATLWNLLRDHVLVEVERPVPVGGVDRRSLAFAHNLLFDYAVARLWIGDNDDDLLDRLAGELTLVLTVWPSFEVAFRRLWDRDPSRAPFWRFVVTLSADRNVRPIVQAIAPGVVVELATSQQDVAGLFTYLRGSDPTLRAGADLLLVQVVGALMAEDPLELAKPSRPWLWFVRELSSQIDVQSAHPARMILQHLLEPWRAALN
jgi:hypothetical protein